MIPPKPNGVRVAFDEGNVIFEIDKDGYITYVNRKFAEFTQFDKKRLVGVHYREIVDPSMPRSLFECMQESTDNGDTWMGYSKNLCADGSHFWAVAYVTPKFENGELIGYTCMFKAAHESVIEEISKMYEKVYTLEKQGEDTCGMIKNIHVT